MAIHRISRYGKWKFTDSQPDLRGTEIKTHQGHLVGIVKDMILDTSARRLTTAVLNDDRQIPLELIELKAGVGWVDEARVFTTTGRMATADHLGARAFERGGERFVPGEFSQQSSAQGPTTVFRGPNPGEFSSRGDAPWLRD